MNKDIDNNADEKLPVEIDYSEQDDQKDQPTISREVERIISSSNDDQIDDEKDQPNDSPENDAEDDLKNANIEIKK